MPYRIKVFMKEKKFLFKLGAILVPAVFASDTPGHAMWVGPSLVFLLAVTHLWGLLLRRLAPSFERGGFWADFPLVIMIGLAACLLDDLAGRAGYGMSVLFPAALVNAGLLLRNESFYAKSKAVLWFLPPFLILSALKTMGLWPGFGEPFFVFTGTAAFLYFTGLALDKKWSSL